MRMRLLVTLILLVIGASSCTDYRKVLKSEDMQYKYDMALEYYKDGKYAKAYPLFDELFIRYRGTEKGEKIAYLVAKCDYGLRDYVLSAHRFSQFYKNYPNSQYAEEAQFLSAHSKFNLSPKYSLDQTDTYSAIRSFQLFTLQFPESQYIDSCNQLMDELRFKLEMKDYKAAKLYYKRERYRAAVVSLGNFNDRYPNSQFKEETWYLWVKASYLLAINSIEEKKEERIEDAIEAYVTFADRFPESRYIKECISYAETLRSELELVQNQS